MVLYSLLFFFFFLLGFPDFFLTLGGISPGKLIIKINQLDDSC